MIEREIIELLSDFRRIEVVTTLLFRTNLSNFSPSIPSKMDFIMPFFTPYLK